MDKQSIQSVYGPVNVASDTEGCGSGLLTTVKQFDSIIGSLKTKKYVSPKVIADNGSSTTICIGGLLSHLTILIFTLFDIISYLQFGILFVSYKYLFLRKKPPLNQYNIR